MKNKNSEKTIINNSDLKLLMLATFRYSLGRRTYMPGFIVNLIIKNLKIFHKQNLKQFIEEINEVKDIGDACDMQTWNKLMRVCDIRLKNKSGVNEHEA